MKIIKWRGPYVPAQSSSRVGSWHLTHWTHLHVILLLVLFAGWLTWYLNPPAPVPATAPATRFSAERAMTYVTAIAQHPHPRGSAEHARVRAYLMHELHELGLAPHIQTADVVKHGRGMAVSGTVHNVVARLAGTRSSRAVLLAAHYDSTHRGPGAGDDAAGVAALLETVRALRAMGSLPNTVIVLFTDGEEDWLLGAKAFVDAHPWAKDVAVVLNVEARGNAGPVVMFETSNENGWLIRQLATVAPYPVAYSFVYDLYKKMPNDTDFTEFKRGGMPGLNFAMAEGWNTYHTPRDTASALDRASLQHYGTYALALTQQFGTADLTNVRAHDAVYFAIGPWLAAYSETWVLPLTGLATLGFVGLVVLGLRRKHAQLSGIGLSVVAFMLNAAIVTALAWLTVQLLIGGLHESAFAPEQPSRLYLVIFALLALASSTLLYRRLNQRLGIVNLLLGAHAWWLLLTVLSAVALPGASYLFVWPLLAAVSVLALALNTSLPERPVVRWASLLPPLVLLAVFIPALWVLFTLLPVTLYPVAAAVTAVATGLLLPHVIWTFGYR